MHISLFCLKSQNVYVFKEVNPVSLFRITFISIYNFTFHLIFTIIYFDIWGFVVFIVSSPGTGLMQFSIRSYPGRVFISRKLCINSK